MKVGVMYYIFLSFIMSVVACRITLKLGYINRKAIEKNLGFVFKPISIKEKHAMFFEKKWVKFFNWFPTEHQYKISLIVFILLPLHLLMYISILLFFIVVILSISTNNETLKLFAYEKLDFYTVIVSLFVSAITKIFEYWAHIWKKPKQQLTFKEQRKAIKDLNILSKKIKNQKWYYPLWEDLIQISIFSNDQKGEYWFKKSQVSLITELVKKSSKKATVNFHFDDNELCSFVVIDITNNEEVFMGLIQKDN